MKQHHVQQPGLRGIWQNLVHLERANSSIVAGPVATIVAVATSERQHRK